MHFNFIVVFLFKESAAAIILASEVERYGHQIHL